MRAPPSPLRVGLVIGQLTMGGAERQLWELVRGLDRRFVPIVYCLADAGGPFADELRRLDVTVRTVGDHGLVRARRLATLLRADRIDLVHAWLFIANGYALAARFLGGRRPLITSARNCKVQGNVSRIVNMLAFRCSQSIVVNSQDVAAYVQQWYRAPGARIRVVYNGIDTGRFHPAAHVGEDGAPGPIVTVGRLVPQKNHELFLAAAVRLANGVPAARFVIVGDGPLRGALQDRARELGIEGRVTFTGERHDVETILRSASLFWLTSRWEGLPNVVLEAMASGLPAIATDVGGARELIRCGVDGFVVTPEDADGFVGHSAALLQDRVMWRQFSRAARARAEEFSTARMVNALAHLYVEVAGCPR